MKVTVINNSDLFHKGDIFYILECTNGVINGYHVFVNPNGKDWCCNVTYEEAKYIFRI